MKIVIDIPEEKYEWIKMNNPNVDINSIVGAVANGTPYEERAIGNKWHDMRENPNDLPTKTRWYICKVKSSHDLRLVFGYEDVIADKFDAWLEVRCDV